MKTSLFSIVALFSIQSAFAADKLTICIENVSYPPLINGTDATPSYEPGKALEVVLDSALYANFTTEFVRRPWARCLKMVEKGQVNALLPSIKTPSRSALFQFPSLDKQFLITAPYHIFYSTHSPHADFFEQLTNASNKSLVKQPELKYGLTAQYGYVAREKLAELDLLASQNYQLEKGLIMVANHKLDGYVVMDTLGREQALKLGLLNKLKVTDKAFMQEKLYLVFNKNFYRDNKQKVDQLWQKMPEARKRYLGF